MQRLYICGLYGDGSKADPYRSAFDKIFSSVQKSRRQVIDGVDVKYALVVSNTDATEHATLIADSKVRHLSKALLLTKRADLTQGQITKINEVLTFLGMTRAGSIFTDQALILDVLKWLNGSRRWDGLIVLEE